MRNFGIFRTAGQGGARLCWLRSLTAHVLVCLLQAIPLCSAIAFRETPAAPA